MPTTFKLKGLGHEIESVLRIRDVYPGSRIPDQKTGRKERGENKNFCQTFFCSHKFHKMLNYLIFELLKKKFEPNFEELWNFLPKKLSLSSQNMSLGSGIRNKPIPDPGSRGQKGPNPGSGSATLDRIKTFSQKYRS